VLHLTLCQWHLERLNSRTTSEQCHQSTGVTSRLFLLIPSRRFRATCCSPYCSRASLSIVNGCFPIYNFLLGNGYGFVSKCRRHCRRHHRPSPSSPSSSPSSPSSSLSSRLRDISNYTTVFACRTRRLVVRMHDCVWPVPGALTRLEDSRRRQRR